MVPYNLYMRHTCAHTILHQTFHVGKWHIRQDPAGFDEWKVLPGQGVYTDPDFIHNGRRASEHGYATDITTDFALDFLRKAGNRPFCLVYQHKAPHRPFTPAPRHAKLFDDIEWPYPETYDDDYATRPLAKEAEDMRFEVSLAGDYDDIPKGLSRKQKRNWIYQRFVKDHHRSVYGVDENLGRVLEYLDVRLQTVLRGFPGEFLLDAGGQVKRIRRVSTHAAHLARVQSPTTAPFRNPSHRGCGLAR